MPRDDADDGAHHARSQSIRDKLERNVAIRIAKGLERARADAFLLYHARHGGKRHERRDEVEKDGKDACERIDDIGNGGAAAGNLAARIDIVSRLFKELELLARLGKLIFRLVELFLGSGELLLVLRQGACVFGLLCGDLLPRRLDLSLRSGTGRGELGGSICELALGILELGHGNRELPICGVELRGARAHLLLELFETRLGRFDL